MIWLPRHFRKQVDTFALSAAPRIAYTENTKREEIDNRLQINGERFLQGRMRGGRW
jgi:hypothetical protein